MRESAISIDQAAHTLMRGELVAFPTETVYGLGADAANPHAVAAIYSAKGRPSDHPVIVHVAEPKDIDPWCIDIPDEAWQLARAFWPGPMTLILERHPDVDPMVSAGQVSIGLRCPSHPVAHALLSAFATLKRQAGESRAGVAAPSANRFGRVSPTSAAHVRGEFQGLVDNGMPVLEGGDCEVGIESTIIDLSSVKRGGAVAILRPGAVSAEQVAIVLGAPVLGQSASSVRASGTLKAHYAPSTPLARCVPDRMRQEVDAWLTAHKGKLAVLTREPGSSWPERVVVLSMPKQATAYAQALYSKLRQLDDSHVAAAIIEQVPDEPAWVGVRDRVSRAVAAFEGS